MIKLLRLVVDGLYAVPRVVDGWLDRIENKVLDRLIPWPEGMIVDEAIDRVICPDDPQHFLDSHAPGGAWYGHGHGGKPSPWKPGVSA